MRKGCHLVLPFVCGLFLPAARPASALEVPLHVAQARGPARKPAVITSGVPFARDAVTDVSALSVSADGKAIPAQLTRTVVWDDGSVRWALLDTQVDVPDSGKVELLLSDSGSNPSPAEPVRVEQSDGSVVMSTGPLALTIATARPGLFASLRLDGRELLAAGQGLVIVTEDGREVPAGPPTEVAVELAGPLRAVVCLRGAFPGLHNGLLRYTARVSVFAGQRLVKVHLWLENHGALGHSKDASRNIEWFAFDGMAVDLGLGLGGELTARCEGAEAKDNLTVLQVCKKGSTKPYFTFDNFEYTVSSRDRQLKKGDRTDGVVEIAGTGGRLTAAIRYFWQNYEKGIELDGRRLRLWLWPREGQWPRPTNNLSHEQLRRFRTIARENLYLLQGSVHKGHEFVLDFSGRPAAEVAAELAEPLFAWAPADYYAATDALPVMFAPPDVPTPNKECNFRLAAWQWMSHSVADPAVASSLFAARRESCAFSIGYYGDSSQWYGWMDFGDLSVPGQGQVSLHFDWPLLVLLEYLRSGDPNSLRLATEMIRHRIDVDQLWSDRDPGWKGRLQRQDNMWPTFHINAQFGGGDPSVTDNWVAGVALWYMLTGEPKAREACLRNVEGLTMAWDDIAKSKPYGGPQGSMAANAWAIESFCAVYDLTADKRWLDEALKLFRTNVTAKWERHGPHLYTPGGQIVGQGYIKDDVGYCYAVGPLCNLHRHSGDADVLKLLVAGCEEPFDDTYFDAPMFLAGLFAYVGVVTEKPEYVKKAASLFARGFPDSRNPPVFVPNNSTWSKDAAMMLRSGYPLEYAFWKQGKGH